MVREEALRRSVSRKSFQSAVSTVSKFRQIETPKHGSGLPASTQASSAAASPNAATPKQGALPRTVQRSPLVGKLKKVSTSQAAAGQDNRAGTKSGQENAGQETGVISPSECICGYECHLIFDKSMPLVIDPEMAEGGYEELLVHSEALLGVWVTLLDRSHSLDAQMMHVGIGKIKRMVMNKLAIQFTATLNPEKTLLDCWISTPSGDKHTRSSLVGEETFDQDGDLGDWTARTSMVNYSRPWFCNGKSFRAMQMKRENPKLGTAYETRALLPDSKEGVILLYNITMYPPNDKPKMEVDRIYKNLTKHQPT